MKTSKFSLRFPGYPVLDVTELGFGDGYEGQLEVNLSLRVGDAEWSGCLWLNSPNPDWAEPETNNPGDMDNNGNYPVDHADDAADDYKSFVAFMAEQNVSVCERDLYRAIAKRV